MRVVYWVTEPGQDRWLYVGRTSRMHQRMSTHYGTSKWTTPTCVWTATAQMRDDLAVRLEQYLVKLNEPRHNVYLKPGSGPTVIVRDPFDGASAEDVDTIMEALDKAQDVTNIYAPAKREPRSKAAVAESWEQFLCEIRAGKWPELTDVMRESGRGRAA